MRPHIQYAQTEDGVNIAHWAMGDGPPLVADVGQWSHIQREWDIPERRAWFERAAEKHTFIRFDHRGSGLSDRNVDDVSLEAYQRDIDAVLDDMGLTQAALFATGTGQRAGITYAATRPERISHLVIWQSTPVDGSQPPVLRMLSELRDVDWEFYTDAMVLWMQGWSAGDASPRIGAFFRDAVSADVAKAVDTAQGFLDVTPELEKLQMPTLLVYRPGARSFSEEMPRQTAARIRRVRTVFLDGSTHAWYVPDSDKLMSAIENFLAGRPPDEAAAAQAIGLQALVADVHIVLFTDIESSSALSQRLDDAKAHAVRRLHNEIVRAALAAHRGTEVKHTGDGIMAAFGMASSALDCAIEIQRAVEVHVKEDPATPLAVYIGLNAGEPIAEEDDLFGTSVDLAARICSHAEPGQILASDVVRQLVAGKRFMFSAVEGAELHGFADPLRLWEIRWRDRG